MNDVAVRATLQINDSMGSMMNYGDFEATKGPVYSDGVATT